MTTTKPKDLPEGSWAITKDDKLEIQKFGRELHKFILGYCKTNAINGKFFPWKIVTGGFDYFQQLQSQKVKLQGDDILVTQDMIEKFGLGEFLEEPFTPVVEEPAPEEAKPEDKLNPAPAPEEVPTAPVVDAPVAPTPVETPAPAPVDGAGLAPAPEANQG